MSVCSYKTATFGELALNAGGGYELVDINSAQPAATLRPPRHAPATPPHALRASGWEEKAEEYLPHLLGLPAGLPFLRFARGQGAGRSIDGHWKLAAIDAYAGGRALAWIDDAFDESCHAWADQRPAPTLLVETDPSLGLTSREARLLTEWALAPTRPAAASPS